jgi:hypothetical protein
MAYAQNTKVDVSASIAEIQSITERYGADQFMFGTTETQGFVGFRVNGRMVKYILPLPKKDERRLRITEAGRERTSPDSILNEWKREVRRCWRSLALLIKANLDAVQTGIITFDLAFLGAIMLPNGSTVGAWMEPQVEEMYASGKMPEVLPGLDSSRCFQPTGPDVVRAEVVE